MSRFRRDAVSVMSSTVAAFLFNFLGGIVLARLLGPEGKGLMAALLAIPYMLIPLCDLGANRSIVYVLGRKQASEEELMPALLVLFCITLTVGNLLILGLIQLIVETELSSQLLFLAAALFSIHMVHAYARGIFLGRSQLDRFNRSLWMVPPLRLVLIGVFVWALGMGVEGAVLAEAISFAWVAFVLLRGQGLTLRGRRIDWSVVGLLLRLGLALSFSVFLLTALYRVDVLMLERMSTLEEAGAYSLAVNIAELLWQIPGAIGLVVMMRTARDTAKGQFARLVPQITRLALLASVCAAIGIGIVAPYLVEIVYGTAFDRTAPMLRWMLPGVAGFAVFKIVQTALTGDGKPWYPVIATVPALIGNIALNFILIPRYQGEGAGMATTISYLGGSLLLVLLYCRGRDVSLLQMTFPRMEDIKLAVTQLRELFGDILRKIRPGKGA